MKNIITIAVILICTQICFAKEKNSTPALRDPAEFQKIVNDYKTYLSKVSKKDREEVVKFRMKIAKLNKQKAALYSKLPPDNQEYLKKEREYKSKLPLDDKTLHKNGKLRNITEFQEAVNDYYEYVGDIPAKTRHEVRKLRDEVQKIQQDKKLLYRGLSQEVQGYFKAEQDYRKKLPLNRKTLINIDE